MIPKPKFTKHYSLGLLVGTGFGLFMAGMLAESGIGVDSGSRQMVKLFGILAIMAGGFMYAMDFKRPAAAKTSE